MAFEHLSVTKDYGLQAALVADKWFGDDGVRDNVYNDGSMWNQMFKRFRKQELAGANEFYWPLDLDEMTGEASYRGADPLSTTQPDTVTAAKVATSEMARQVVISERQTDLVRGERAVLAVMLQQQQKAARQLVKDMDVYLMGDGTDNDSKRPLGLKIWVASDPTSATYAPGDLSQANNTNHRNQTKDNSNTSGNVLSDLIGAVSASQDGDAGPTWAVGNRAFRNKLEALIGGTGSFYHNPIVQGGGEPGVGKSGDPSIGKVFYRGIPIYVDANWVQYGTAAGPGQCIFLDSSSFILVNAAERASTKNFIHWTKMIRGFNQTAEAGFMRSHFQLACVERRRNLCFFNVAA